MCIQIILDNIFNLFCIILRVFTINTKTILLLKGLSKQSDFL